jgi:hypothetical protein
MVDAEKTAKKQRVIGRPFKKGQSGNPAGKPAGLRSFKTIFEEAVKKIAKEEQIDPNSVEVKLVKTAIESAAMGRYTYYKDIFDRLYGQPTQKVEQESKQIIELSVEDKKRIDDLLKWEE